VATENKARSKTQKLGDSAGKEIQNVDRSGLQNPGKKGGKGNGAYGMSKRRASGVGGGGVKAELSKEGEGGETGRRRKKEKEKKGT